MKATHQQLLNAPLLKTVKKVYITTHKMNQTVSPRLIMVVNVFGASGTCLRNSLVCIGLGEISTGMWKILQEWREGGGREGGRGKRDEGGREGGGGRGRRKRGKERAGGRERGREGGREGEREGGREGGREGEREEGEEGGGKEGRKKGGGGEADCGQKPCTVPYKTLPSRGLPTYTPQFPPRNHAGLTVPDPINHLP